jgi:hypothetical protein
MATTLNPDKLSFGFADAASFRYAGKQINLAKADDELKVLDKHGNEKTIKGFQAADGTFFRLKKTAEGRHQIDVYGTPEQLARSNLQVRGGDITRARFGDDRYRKPDPSGLAPRDFELNGIDSKDIQAFVSAYGLSRRGGAALSAGPVSTPVSSPALSQAADDDLTDELLKKRLDEDRQQAERRMSEASARNRADRLADEAPGVGRRHSVARNPSGEVSQQSVPTPTGSLFEDISERDVPFEWTADTRIDTSNRDALAAHPGLGSYFTDPDPSFRDLLSRHLALRFGHPEPSPGASPIDYLGDGSMTLGELTQLIDGLSVAMAAEAPRQRPAEVLAALGRTPIDTLDDGNCLFAALAHGLSEGDSRDYQSAIGQRRALLAAFEQAIPDPDQVTRIAGRADTTSIERVRSTLSRGLDGGPVDADGWGGEEAIKLAAMKYNRTIITVSDQDTRLFDPRGEVTIYVAAARDALIQAAAQIEDPVMLMIQGFHWQATESVNG